MKKHQEKLVPIVSAQNFKRTLVTSALPYANGYCHLGHLAGAYLPADIYTRYLRSCGEEVIHVSGSDEHGAAVTISADKEGVTPREIADRFHTANEAAFRGAGIDFDVFGRTVWEEHHKTAQQFFLALYEGGYLAEKEEEQFYDSEAKMFLPDRYVEGTCPNCGFEGARGDQCDNCSATYNQTELLHPISKVSGKTPERRTTKHFYLKLGDFQQRLEAYVESHSREWRDHVLQQSRSWLKQGLGDRSITRDLEWGVDVPLPGYEGKKLYVWFDAPFGYITNTKVYTERSGNPDAWKTWWCNSDTRYIAFIGKDNIVFHTLMFPAMLMGYNDAGKDDRYIIPDNVPACEFLNLEGRKFSKSNHWGIDLRDYLSEYSADPLRYTIAANLPENKDSDFTWREYQARNNNELADILGNFVNRTFQFAIRYFDGVVPALIGDTEKEGDVRKLLANDLERAAESGKDREAALDELEPKYLKYITRSDLTMLLELATAPKRIGALYDGFRYRDALLETMNVAREANRYFDRSEPWKTRKDNPEGCATTLNICLQVVRSLTVLFQPIIPESAGKMLEMLKLERTASDTWQRAGELVLPTGHALGEPVILFAKFDDEAVEREVAKLGKAEGEPEQKAAIEVALKPEITIDDVAKLDLRVAIVVEAERVKKSKKLLKLKIRVGNLERQIIAGIAQGYAPEELIGKQIVVVANLKPATLLGIESQGMLLAANDPDESSGAFPTLVVIGESHNVRDGFIVR